VGDVISCPALLLLLLLLLLFPQIEIIQGLPEDATISLYRVGPMVDLCTGPHLPSTGCLKVRHTNPVFPDTLH
jgi:hypothetical protein